MFSCAWTIQNHCPHFNERLPEELRIPATENALLLSLDAALQISLGINQAMIACGQFLGFGTTGV
jgi:hypothetical protein